MVVVDNEVNEVGLLEDGTAKDLTADAGLETEALGVGVGPAEELG